VGGLYPSFVILVESAVASERCEEAFDDPSSWQQDEALGVLWSPDDFEGRGGFFDKGVFELLACIPAVGEEFFQVVHPAVQAVSIPHPSNPIDTDPSCAHTWEE